MAKQDTGSTPKKKHSFLEKLKSRTGKIIIAVLLVIVIVLGWFVWYTFIREPEVTVSFTSELLEALDIDELSTSSFTYNGIADVYDSKTNEISYSVLYHATVKAGISVEDLDIEVDEELKQVHVILPEVRILNAVVDPASIDFIPDRADIQLKEALATCRSDVTNEATASSELLDAAQENLQSIVEALTLPVIEGSGYTLVW